MKTLLKKFAGLCLLAVIFASCDCTRYAASGNPAGLISVADGELYEANYTAPGAQYDVINTELGIIDNREFVFTVDNIKHYLCYAESLSQEKGLESNPEELAVRIYLGAKVETVGQPAKTAVFLVATRIIRDDTGNIIGYENIKDVQPLNYGNSGRPPVRYQDD